MQLFYNSTIHTTTSEFSFDKEESKHIVKVLRKQESDILMVTNGLGYFFTTKITLATEKKCTVTIVSFEQQPKKNYYIHLAVAPTKMNERYEWFLEKVTEIGIDEITPILCEHSERKIIKQDRFEKIILSAMKQSNQSYLPQLNPALTFNQFISKQHTGALYIAHCDNTHKTPLKQTILAQQHYTLLIGPEGDFSTKEIQLALQKQFVPVTLGNTRLRTETAAVVACHSLVFANE